MLWKSYGIHRKGKATSFWRLCRRPRRCGNTTRPWTIPEGIGSWRDQNQQQGHENKEIMWNSHLLMSCPGCAVWKRVRGYFKEKKEHKLREDICRIPPFVWRMKPRAIKSARWMPQTDEWWAPTFPTTSFPCEGSTLVEQGKGWWWSGSPGSPGGQMALYAAGSCDPELPAVVAVTGVYSRKETNTKKLKRAGWRGQFICEELMSQIHCQQNWNGVR